MKSLFKIFNNHPNKNGFTYFQHNKFAILTSLHLGTSAIFFAIHAVFPFIPMPALFNCKAIIATLDECAKWEKSD